eukprot:CAMPEP_0114488962 /NCGR_PEP_ID=MMETSP0109-20121206/1622_1 /TAXON_ID=29199 /ORGANISM="Chlorarachnion reptans, Strain CCCM449" /LENGTH=1192 /DNA_ID=CAMNT_0001665415 /DNA_START=494 /DNA_END=4072 /DNA_ORIENTATION=-
MADCMIMDGIMSGAHLSRDFFELIKNIGESRSKQEEDRIILSEMRTLKEKMKEKGVSSAKMKELCIRMIYVEMLGHEANFGYINAINLSCTKNLIEKRVGYLACCLCLHKDHQLMLLLVSTIQKDLNSDNFLEVSMALTVVCRLISSETIPVIMPMVLKLLDHSNPNVRKKAIGCMNRFQELDPVAVASSLPRCKKLLYDKDPSVMGASLIIVESLVAEKPQAHKELTKTLVSILKQVTEHCLSREYDYHRVPAPWIQLKLLRILGYLGDGDKEASEAIYPILKEVMKRADIGINVGYAIVYECVRTAISIYLNRMLLQEAASSISRFLTSDNHNLKYLGINALAGIVQIDAKHAVKHQLMVIDCLEDPDDTLRRKTLDLLYSMTNPQNVRVIMQKLMTFLESTVDEFLRSELVSKITQIAEKFAPDNAWYIETVNTVFELGGDLVRPEMAHNLINLVASEDVDPADPDNIRIHAVDTYIKLLAKPNLPIVLLKTVAWVLGEYGYLSKQTSTEALLLTICDAMEQLVNGDSEAKHWLLCAAMKICSHSATPQLPAELHRLVKKYKFSSSVSLQQKAHEFLELIQNKGTAVAALPRDKFGAEEKIDSSLSFLNGYVGEARANGAPEYKPRDVSQAALSAAASASANNKEKKKSTLQFQAYERQGASYESPATPSIPASAYPTSGTATSGVMPSNSPYGGAFGEASNSGASATPARTTAKNDASSFFASGGPWGAEGFNAGTSKPEETTTPGVSGSLGTTSSNPYSGMGSATTAKHDYGGNETQPNPTPAPAIESVRSPTQQTSSSAPPSQRQRLAMGLFAGIGAEAEQKSEVPPQTVPVVAPAAQQIPTAVPVPRPKPAPVTNVLFEVDDDEPVKQNGATTTTTTNNSASFGGLDLNSLFSSDPVPEQKNIGGFTGDAFTETKESVENLMGTKPDFPCGAAGMSAKLTKSLSGFKKSPEVVSANAPGAYVSHEKVFLPGQTLLTVFLTNTGAPASGVSTQLKTQEGLFLRCNAEPKASLQEKQDLNTQRLQGGLLSAKQTMTIMSGIFCRDPNVLTRPNLNLEVKMTLSGGATAACNVGISLPDVLRPLSMNVSQYGTTWKKLRQEKKDQLSVSKISQASDLEAVATSCQLKLVKIIGQECILASKLVTGSKTVLPLLLHAKVKAGSSILFMVRSNSPALSEAGLAMIKEACK